LPFGSARNTEAPRAPEKFLGRPVESTDPVRGEGENAGTQIALVALHLLAAAIIVPVLARHAHS
jgi:hypothetical protein